ncbi:MAG: hypothetical protein R2704_05475 [Microthrixaceae bacterium]
MTRVVAATDGAPDDEVLFDTPLARLAIGSAGAVDRLITRTQGQVALGLTVGRLLGAQAGLPVEPPSIAMLDRPRLHPVRQMQRTPNVTPLRPSDALSAVSPAEPPATAAAAELSVPSVDALAVPGYDELAASQVVKRLDGLTADELGAVEAYERANRGRRTILARVHRLQTTP